MDLAIIASAIPARKELLKRSIMTWGNSIADSGLDAKVYLYLEDMTEWDDFYYRDYLADGYLGDIKIARKSGSHITGYNFWLDHIKADKYLFTHPDLLFPSETVKVAYELSIPNRFVAFKVFWMSEEMTDEIERYNWRKPETLEEEKALFPLHFSDNHGDFYWNSDVRAKTEWHSTTTWAMDHDTLAKLRPIPDFKMQGPDDPYLYAARMRLKINDYCVMNPILFHQHHPQTWDQNMPLAIELATKALVERFG